MDCTNGKLYTQDEYDSIIKKFPEVKEIMRLCIPTPEQVKRGKVEIKEICPCGSGKTFGKCCRMVVKKKRKIYWENIIKEGLNNK